MKNRNRVFALLLAVILCVSLLPIGVLADEAESTKVDDAAVLTSAEEPIEDTLEVSAETEESDPEMTTPEEDETPVSAAAEPAAAEASDDEMVYEEAENTVVYEESFDEEEEDTAVDTADEEADEADEENWEEISVDGDSEGYVITFSSSEHFTVNVYYTQDYTTADETNVTTAYARDGETGDIDTSGSGQVNFEIVPEDGYEVETVTADANYKNIKDQGNNIWRITKITGDVSVTITVVEEEEEETVIDPITTSAETGYSYAVVGNTGAVITMDSVVSAAKSSNTDVAEVSYEDKVVTVAGVEGAVGITTVTVTAGGGSYSIQVPIGYTTFVFEDTSVRVYEGSGGYDATGINADGTETELSGEEDTDGSTTYTNTSDYSVQIELKKSGGYYVFAGTAADMSVSVKKEATGAAILYLTGVDLTSGLTAPITVKKNSSSTVTITALAGHTNTLTDADFNNADTYGATDDGGDGTNENYAESSVIKGKAYANITLNGTGTLNLVCKTKNAIKVGDYGCLTIGELDLNVTSAKNGISSDNLMYINSGTITVEAEADGIRSDPDYVGYDDYGCTANIYIRGGNVTITAGADGIQPANDLVVSGGTINVTSEEDAVHTGGNINISGGTITVAAQLDGLQAEQDMTISGGTFDITTMNGYISSGYDADTMSCKGIKTSSNDEDTENATNNLTITGGTFTLNTADDAIHSDGNIYITGGTFTIYTGDDGAHADTILTLGEENGSDTDVVLTVCSSYEGLEAGTVYIYSGSYKVTASDDGVNAAGGSTNGTETGGNDHFNPWGGGGMDSSSTGSYNLYIYGGNISVDSTGDGLDSNGGLYLYGGNIVVWGPSDTMNQSIDVDGDFVVKGATVFAACAAASMWTNPTNSQTYKVQSNKSYSADTTITVLTSGNAVFQGTTPRNIKHIFFSSPDMSSGSSMTISTNYSGAVACWHTYKVTKYTEATCTEEGSVEYECTVCGETTTKTIAALGHNYEGVVTAPTCTEEGYTTYTCSRCGESYTADTTAATGHTFVDGVCTVCGEKESDDNETGDVLGDVDGDGEVTGFDASLILQYEVGLIDESGLDLSVADVDGDGEVTGFDASLILQYEVGLIESF